MNCNNRQKLHRLPLGDVRANGWLAEQLRRNIDGMGGHLWELEPQMIAAPYTTRETYEGWAKECRAGWGAEISGNYWWGFIELAFISGDTDMLRRADEWVNAVLANRLEDGYLGTYREGDDFYDDYNAWGTSCGMNALLAYYDATGSKDVLDAVHGCMLWFCEKWKGDMKTRYAGMTIIECMVRVYLLTHDERLLRFCYDYFDFMERNDIFDASLSAMLSPELHYNSTHGSLYANQIDRPALMYVCGASDKYLEASLNAYRKAKEKVLLPNGGITCESEYLAPVGAVVETEYCSATFYNKSLANLAMITGDPCFADDMEQTVFNFAEGARKKDERAIAYLSSPNQIMAKASSSYANEGHQVYAPCVPVACCPVNSVRILPEFLRNAVLEGDDGLYFSVYAPCVVSHAGMKITLETDYPFRETLTFRFEQIADSKDNIVCRFRIPGWCENPTALLNGETVSLTGEGYVCADHNFTAGDVFVLTLPMKPRITFMNDADRLCMHPISVFRGPLLFSLAVPESWYGHAGRPATPLPEGWQWYDIDPIIPCSDLNVYDNMGMRRRMISWNAALSETLTPEAITVTDDGGDGYPWESSPIKLSLTGYRAPYSYPPYPQKTLDPYVENGYAYVDEEMPLTLIPYGCTALRISCFPRAKRPMA